MRDARRPRTGSRSARSGSPARIQIAEPRRQAGAAVYARRATQLSHGVLHAFGQCDVTLAAQGGLRMFEAEHTSLQWYVPHRGSH